jgi:hypothetical protein
MEREPVPLYSWAETVSLGAIRFEKPDDGTKPYNFTAPLRVVEGCPQDGEGSKSNKVQNVAIYIREGESLRLV